MTEGAGVDEGDLDTTGVATGVAIGVTMGDLEDPLGSEMIFTSAQFQNFSVFCGLKSARE